MELNLRDRMMAMAQNAKTASRALGRMGTADKNTCLLAMADALERGFDAIQSANTADMATGAQAGLSASMLDRLKLDGKRVAAMASGIREVAELADPVGRVLDSRVRPNGLSLEKVATPIGVVVIIYESRPNVTADAASLCFKSGNATILRGGKEALHSNQIIGELMVAAARTAFKGFPEHAIQVVPTTDREAIRELLSLTDFVDLCLPRGGESLIRAVTECSKVPVIKHYKGVCHVYVDAGADFGMAQAIVMNAKVQRPAVCNAMETLLVDRAIAPAFLGAVGSKLAQAGVQLRADAESEAHLTPHVKDIRRATETDYRTEYNDYILNVAVVGGLDEAIDHIGKFGSAHSDSIVTGDESRARKFLSEVDSAAVYWNASTRFTDGREFGMGAEIGISTDKIGARGPMGLDELTSYKWVVVGNGQLRES